MPTQVTLRVSGLHVDPNPHGDMPAGALRVASNVMLTSPGIAEPRPGFATEAPGVLGGYARVFTHPTGERYARDTGATVLLEDDAGTSVTDPASNPVELASPELSGAFAGDAYYVAGANELLRLDTLGATEARYAGLPRAMTPTLSGTALGDFISQNEAVAYRLVYVEERGDRTLFSAPSGRVEYRELGAGSTGLRLALPLPAEATTSWRVQLYRGTILDISLDALAQPDDVMRLIADLEVSSADLVAGFLIYDDNIEAAAQAAGAALYTNADQDTIVAANERPPAMRTLAELNGMLLGGNVTRPHRMILDFQGPVVDSGSFTANTTIGSPTLTGIDPTVFPEAPDTLVGRAIAGALIPADTTVIAADSAAQTLTLSNNATATAGATTITSCRAFLEVEGTRFDFSVASGLTADWLQTSTTTIRGTRSLWARVLGQLASGIARETGLIAYYAGNPTEASGRLVIERARPSEGSFTVTVDAGRTYIVPEVGSASGSTYTSVQEAFAGRLAISRDDQPEAFPESQFIDIGDRSLPIMAIATTRSRAFIFKPDGCWVLQGTDPAALDLQELDRTLRLVHPRAVAALSDTLYAWTMRGVERVDEGGPRPISGAINDVLRDARQLFDGATTTATGPFLAAHEPEQLLFVGVPGAGYLTTDLGVSNLYVWSAETGAWATWNVETATLVGDVGSTFAGRMILAGSDGANGVLGPERARAEAVVYADGAAAVGIGAVNAPVDGAQTLTVSGTTVAVGDLLVQNEVRGLALASGTTVPFVLLQGEFSAGAGTLYSAFTSELEWWMQEAPGPAYAKHWSEGSVFFDDMRGAWQAALSFASDARASVATFMRAVRSAAGARREPQSMRFIVPRSHRRAAQIFPSLRVTQAGAFWRLSHLAFTYTTSGTTRTGRRSR